MTTTITARTVCACGHTVDEHATDGCTFGWGYPDGRLVGGCTCPNEGERTFLDLVG